MEWREVGSPTKSVVVDGATPTLEGADVELLHRILENEDLRRAWRDSAEREKAPLEWLVAIAFGESRGDAKAVSPDGQDWGLMQINKSNFGWLGLDESSALDAYRSTQAAIKILAAIQDRKPGRGFVESMSIYNAGGDAKTGNPHPSASSPWGVRETPGAILAKVKALNTLDGTLNGAVEGAAGGLSFGPSFYGAVLAVSGFCGVGLIALGALGSEARKKLLRCIGG